MAEKQKKGSSALTRLVPSTTVRIDGHDVMVPNGVSENANANRLLASQMRDLFQRQLKKYKDGDVGMTPKELKELSDAARNIAEFSGIVYKESADINGTIKPSRGEVPVDPSTDDINLDSIGPQKVEIPEIKEDDETEE